MNMKANVHWHSILEFLFFSRIYCDYSFTKMSKSLFNGLTNFDSLTHSLQYDLRKTLNLISSLFVMISIKIAYGNIHHDNVYFYSSKIVIKTSRLVSFTYLCIFLFLILFMNTH